MIRVAISPTPKLIMYVVLVLVINDRMKVFMESYNMIISPFVGTSELYLCCIGLVTKKITSSFQNKF